MGYDPPHGAVAKRLDSHRSGRRLLELNESVTLMLAEGGGGTYKMRLNAAGRLGVGDCDERRCGRDLDADGRE